MLFRKTQRMRGTWMHLLLLAMGFAFIYFCIDWCLNRFAFSAGWTILWPLNGVTIAVLLSNRRRHWPAIMFGVALGTGLGELFDSNPLGSVVWQRFFSVTEVVISASLLPPFVTLDRWLRTPQIFTRFVAALALGPAISGVMAAILFKETQGVPYLIGFNNWVTADAIGIAATMPLTLSVRAREMLSLFRGRAAWRSLIIILCALGITEVIFSTSPYPLLFLCFPMLLLVDALLSFPGAALVVVGMCLIAVYNSTHGWGPFGAWPADLQVSRDVALQLFLGFHMIALFPASLLFMERKRMAEKLRISNERLQMLASLDGLTAIPNRRSLDDRFAAEWKRAVRAQSSLALLMIDIDHFKQFNDLYGHLSGDQCLQEVARELAGCLRRPEDFLARYGGEEFAVLLPSTDLDGAMRVAEGIRATVLGQVIVHAASPTGFITVSIGCAACLPRRGSGFLDLLRLADTALYRAKKAGRNRVEAAAPIPEILL